MPSARTRVLTVSFVRTHGAPDRVHVQRPDGAETGWSFPSYGNDLPHDLVHLVVESSFGVVRGFWGRVAAGVDVARINAEANRRGGKDKYAAFGDDLGDLYVAEALANARWSHADASDEDVSADIARECWRSGVEVPASVTAAKTAEVRQELEVLRRQWRALAPRGVIRTSFRF